MNQNELNRISPEQQLPTETLPGSHIEVFNAGNNLALITGQSNPQLARDIAEILGMTLDEPVSNFSDGERRVQIAHNLRGLNVAIIHPTCGNATQSVNDSLMELYLMADAARKGSAKSISAVVPYYGYSRQDRKTGPREPISASLVASFCEDAGINHLLTLDLHAEQTTGSFAYPWDNLPGSYAYIPIIEQWDCYDNLMVISPDAGRLKADEKIANKLGVPLASIFKTRSPNGRDVIDVNGLMGNVEGYDCVLIDDLTSSGGTLIKGADLLLSEGAKSVRAVVTHPVFSTDAIDNIYHSPIEEMVFTDTIPQEIPKQYASKFTIASVAPMLADAIRMNQIGESLSETFF